MANQDDVSSFFGGSQGRSDSFGIFEGGEHGSATSHQTKTQATNPHQHPQYPQHHDLGNGSQQHQDDGAHQGDVSALFGGGGSTSFADPFPQPVSHRPSSSSRPGTGHQLKQTPAPHQDSHYQQSQPSAGDVSDLFGAGSYSSSGDPFSTFQQQQQHTPQYTQPQHQQSHLYHQKNAQASPPAPVQSDADASHFFAESPSGADPFAQTTHVDPTPVPQSHPPQSLVINTQHVSQETAEQQQDYTTGYEQQAAATFNQQEYEQFASFSQLDPNHPETYNRYYLWWQSYYGQASQIPPESASQDYSQEYTSLPEPSPSSALPALSAVNASDPIGYLSLEPHRGDAVPTLEEESPAWTSQDPASVFDAYLEEDHGADGNLQEHQEPFQYQGDQQHVFVTEDPASFASHSGEDLNLSGEGPPPLPHLVIASVPCY